MRNEREVFFHHHKTSEGETIAKTAKGMYGYYRNVHVTDRTIRDSACSQHNIKMPTRSIFCFPEEQEG